MKIIVIGARESGTKNDPAVIADSLATDTTTVDLLYWEELIFSVKGSRVEVQANGADIMQLQPDLVIAVGWYKNGKNVIYRDVAFALSLYLKHHEVRFWNSEMGHQRSSSKLSCMVQLALEGVPVPATLFSLDKSLVASRLAVPFIAKAAAASRGQSNYLVVSNDDERWRNEDVAFLLQEFLPNDHDLRVICFAGKPALILRRSRQADALTHLNNTSQGGQACWLELSEVPPQLLTLSEKICRIMGREMGGIDFIPDESSREGGYSCLEVNAVPQLTSGTDSDKKMHAFLAAIRQL